MEVTRLLISFKADINSQDRVGCTPLHYAIDNNYIQIIKLLLESQADINAQTKKTETLFYTAFTNFVQLPLQSWLPRIKKNLCGEKFDGWTPLHVSVWAKNSNIEVVKLLLQSQANVNAQTEKMETPLHLLIHALKAVLTNEKTANSSSNKNKNVSPNEDEDEDVDVDDTEDEYNDENENEEENETQDEGETHNEDEAQDEDEDDGEGKEEEKDLKCNLIEIAKLLISVGADISLKDKYWRTPLFLARWYRITELVKLFTEPKQEQGLLV